MNKKAFENNTLAHKLMKAENFEVVETILAKKLTEFNKIKKIKNELDFGPKINYNTLTDALTNVKSKVDTFLNYKGEDRPSIELNPDTENKILFWSLTCLVSTGAILIQTVNWLMDKPVSASWLIGGLMGGLTAYHTVKNALKKTSVYQSEPLQNIKLNRHSFTIAIPVISHEYTHFLQDQKGLIDYNYLTEGHASGVQNEIANQFFEETGNKAFQYDIQDAITDKLLNTYLVMAEKFTKKAHLKLVGERCAKSLDEYDIGTTLFMIEEERKGKEIYKQVLQGKNIFT